MIRGERYNLGNLKAHGINLKILCIVSFLVNLRKQRQKKKSVVLVFPFYKGTGRYDFLKFGYFAFLSVVATIAAPRHFLRLSNLIKFLDFDSNIPITHGYILIYLLGNYIIYNKWGYILNLGCYVLVFKNLPPGTAQGSRVGIEPHYLPSHTAYQ